jgi:chemotaxis regulatin CheY-phosphate phosphatase CheZ
MPDNKSKMTQQIRGELKELTDSINVMMSTFRSIKQPMQESSDKLPTTTDQLERVTEQTESATNKVLDMVESISNRESDISSDIKKIQEIVAETDPSKSEELNKILEQMAGNADANINDAYNIMDALQFQDITTQQIDHAISLLDDVEDKLHVMLKAVGVKPDKKPVAKDRKKAFDPNATYSTSKATQQDDIDQIISGLK